MSYDVGARAMIFQEEKVTFPATINPIIDINSLQIEDESK